MATFAIAALVAVQGVMAGEGVHLVNCSPKGGGGDPNAKGEWISAVTYCANDADCSRLDYVPSDVCIVSRSDQPGFFRVWEGSEQSCTFSSGVTFKWNIPRNAQDLQDYSWIGLGYNGSKTFNGYKDNNANGAGLGGHSCTKIYYYA